MKTKHGTAKIEVTKDGPYLVSGGPPLSEQWIVTNAGGDSLEYREGKKFPAQSQYALCRCGQSANKPFCDGSHAKVKFDGTETASHQPYLKQAETIEGPTMLLTDQENLCAFARFCDPKGRDLESRQAGQPRSPGNCKTRGRALSRRTAGDLG
jgi:CDGSH-type Zn-finger protein